MKRQKGTKSKILSDEVLHFIRHQNFVIVSTIDENGKPHSSCKGIVKIEPDGTIYLLDLYRAKTHDNLTKNKSISIAAVDEHRFSGYCLKGKARMLKKKDLTPGIIKAWEGRITQRITQRILKNISGEKGHHRHPEVLLPDPKYLIVVEVSEVVNLTPQHISMA